MSQPQVVWIQAQNREAIMFVMLCIQYVILKQELKSSEVKLEFKTELQETRRKNSKYVYPCSSREAVGDGIY